jgi:hypothetical protein
MVAGKPAKLVILRILARFLKSRRDQVADTADKDR